ncbi:MAG: hypothetical protein ACRDPV_13525 [Gaiellaceae bacterium]
MSEDGRVGEIDASMDAAVAAVGPLGDQSPTKERLEGALAFARVSLHATDPGLITDSAKDALIAAAQRIAEQPELAVDDSQYFEELMAAVLELPAARGRDIEQVVKDAAANYQRSMAQRIKGLEEQTTAAESAVAETEQHIAAASEEVKTAISDQTDAFQVEIDALTAKVEGQQAALDAQLTRHTEAFSASLEENARKFQTQTTEFAETLSEHLTQADTRVAEKVRNVEAIADDVGVLAGKITLKETAEYYKDEAKDQKSAADRFRWLTVVVALAAVAIGVWAVVSNASKTNTLVAKLGVSLVLGALAGYTASQSGKHRRREARAKDLQLQLTAFSPFTAPLNDELQQAERIRMTRKTFGARSDGAEDDEDDFGPNFLGAVRRVIRGEPEPDEG